MHLGGCWGSMIVFPLEVVSLEGNPSLTRRREEEMSPDKNRCPFHVYNLYFNFLFLQTERIYFQVFLPKGSKEKSKPMFFCQQWSIGRVIDFAASLASLKNDNNKLTPKVTTGYNFFPKSFRILYKARLLHYDVSLS